MKSQILVAYNKKIVEWAYARNIIKGATAKDQCLKLCSEFGEMCTRIAYLQGMKNTLSEEGALLKRLQDDFGDQFVVLSIISEQIGMSYLQVLEHANLCPAEHEMMSREARPYILGAELGYLADNLLKKNHQAAATNIANCFFLLEEVSSNMKLKISQSVSMAYNEIKDRKGVMYEGSFVKSSDVNYPEILKKLGIEE